MKHVQAWAGGGGGGVIKKSKGHFTHPITQFKTNKISTAGGKTNKRYLKPEAPISSTLMTLDARSSRQNWVVISLSC